MSSLKYGFAELQALASDIKSNEAKLRETHDELRGYVNGLVAQWESGARENYQAVQAKWDNAHEDLLQVLQTISEGRPGRRRRHADCRRPERHGVALIFA